MSTKNCTLRMLNTDDYNFSLPHVGPDERKQPNERIFDQTKVKGDDGERGESKTSL